MKTLLDTKLIKNSSYTAIDKYNDATGEIRRLIKYCDDNNERFRAIGASWSMNNITYCNDNVHINSNMNVRWRIQPQDLHESSELDASDLFFFQCGNKIKSISNYLRQFNKALKTSGASNGQSIAGAVSTGVHCSAIDVGAIQDAVVGLQLIIGPGTDDVIYVERASVPALNDMYIAQLHARVIRDDQVFNAALVGLGAFGFIHGVLIETEDLYLLKRYTRLVAKEQVSKFVKLLDRSASERVFLTGIQDIDEAEGGIKPFHYKLYINPYNSQEDYCMEIMYKKPYRSENRAGNTVQHLVYTELIDVVGSLASRYSRQIPLLLKAMKKSIFPLAGQVTEGTHGEIFSDTKYTGPAFGIAFGVALEHYERGVETMIRIANQYGPVPGALGIRFVKASAATLGFTKFPLTCIVEMDGLRWDDTRNMVSLEDFEAALFRDLQRQGIPFTLHWGKNTAWSMPGLTEYMYGTRDDEWIAVRSRLLGKKMCDIFSNEFLDKARLSGYSNPEILA